MPLHLAQHKSYHPYNQGNREKVRRDQAQEAQLQEEQSRACFAHRDQARLEALRADRKALATHSPASEAARPNSSSGSIDSYQAHNKVPRGYALLRPEDELTPWYTTPQLRNGAETLKTEDQRLEDAYKDSSVKSSNDPLKAMQTFLAQRKAVKDSPRSHTSSSSAEPLAKSLSDQYEPEAVRAAKSARRRFSDHLTSSSPTNPNRSTNSYSRSTTGASLRSHNVTDEARRRRSRGRINNDGSRRRRSK